MKTSVRAKVLVGVAAAITAYVVFVPSDPPTADAVHGRIAAPHVRVTRSEESHRVGIERALLLLAKRVSNEGSAGSLFAAHSWYTPPPPPPPPPAPPVLSAAELAVINAPQAPPIPFSYIGSYSPDGSKPVYFLTQGDRVYDVRVGDTIDGLYTMDSFTNGQLVMTYKPLNKQQQLSVGGSQ